MAPKNHQKGISRFVENPPSASPSQDHEEEEELSEEELSEEEFEEEQVQTPQKTLTKTQHPQKPKSPSSSSSEEEGSDDDDTKGSPTASDFTIKPTAIHTTKHTTKNQQQTKPSSKRVLEVKKDDEKKGSGKKKIKLSAENGEETKSVAVNSNSSGGGIMVRIWSEDDEIAILKGMIDYQSQKGADPQADMVAFHEFVKGKFQFDVTKTQLYEKIRRLKKKFLNNLNKGDNGHDPDFPKPHDFSCFELSKKIWGKSNTITNGVDENLASNDGKAEKSFKIKSSESGKIKSVEVKMKEDGKKKKQVEEEAEEDDDNMIVDKEVVKNEVVTVDEVDFSSKYPYLSASYDVRDLHMSETLRKFQKENIFLIDHEKAKELDEKWKRLRIQEIDIFSRRSKLMIEQAKLVMDAMKKK